MTWFASGGHALVLTPFMTFNMASMLALSISVNFVSKILTVLTVMTKF